MDSISAAWRVFGFPIHERDPAVHLENGQHIFFTIERAIEHAMNPNITHRIFGIVYWCRYFWCLCTNTTLFRNTTLFHMEKKWMLCKQGTPIDACPGLFKLNTLGREYAVNARQTEVFYLRLLLVNVTIPLSFQDIRNVNRQQYPTFREACLALSLLEDDNHQDNMLAKAPLSYTGTQFCYSIDYMFPKTSRHDE